MIFQGSKIYQFIMEAGEFVLYKQKLHCGYWVFLSRYSKWSYDFLMPKESSSLMIYLPNKTLVLGNRVLQWTYTDLFINEPRYWGYLHYDSWLISRVAKKCIWNEWADANPRVIFVYFFSDLNWDIAIFLSGTNQSKSFVLAKFDFSLCGRSLWAWSSSLYSLSIWLWTLSKKSQLA